LYSIRGNGRKYYVENHDSVQETEQVQRLENVAHARNSELYGSLKATFAMPKVFYERRREQQDGAEVSPKEAWFER